MGILLTIAGIIIGLYTLSSVIGLWLACQIMEAVEEGEPLSDALDEAPAHHIELMTQYAQGWRRYAWSVSIFALLAALISLSLGRSWAFWALGLAIFIDMGMFMTFPGIKTFLSQTNLQERLIDAAQSVVLLLVLALLAWINLRAGQILR